MLTGSTLTNNYVHASGGFYYDDAWGGAIVNFSTATVAASTLTGNYANGAPAFFDSRGGVGGGIANFGTATVSASSLTGNSASTSGGGIYNAGSGEGGGATLIINQHSTVKGNIAPHGTDLEDLSLSAVISADSTVTLINN
jgi:hypothetical protein